MRDVLLTSSALILALLILRRLFRKTLSRRAQYALWGLVLLRLLIPVSFPAAEFSLLTAAEPVVENMEALYAVPDQMSVWGRDGAPVMGPPDGPLAAVGPATPDNTYAFSDRDALENPVEGFMTYKHQFLLKDLLPPIWYGGMTVMTLWLILSNLLFRRKLRKGRRPYAAVCSKYPVYLVETGLPSPCLFGLFRPAIYLTPAATASPEALRHVLAHEETHARHLDPLWSLLRGVCLVVYWFDPLVWCAAFASRTDCELACDEGALRRLGEAERIPYGRTLLALIPLRRVPADPLLSATTMTADKRRLMDRVTRIAENRRSLGTALFAVISLAALVCAVTFTGAKANDASRPLTEKELSYFNGEFFTERYGPGENRRRQFLTCLYDRPESIDFYEVLYNGTGLPEEITDEERQFMDHILESAGAGEYNYIRFSAANVNAFLQENAGINRYSLLPNDQGFFWWNADGEAYYNLCLKNPGNPRRSLEPVTFTSGQREGDLVQLYYQGMFFSEGGDGRRGPARLTLREKPDGGWLFLSNEWALSGSPSAAPDWESIYTIPLDGLEPYEPEIPETIPIAYDHLEMLDGPEDPDHILGDNCLMFFRNGEGRVFAGVQNILLSSWPPAFWSCLPGKDSSYSVSFFRGLLGHDGFCITITDDGPIYRRSDYYYLNEEGLPVHLAQVDGWPEIIDLDGDGDKELASQSFYSDTFYFQRDGRLYRITLEELLAPYWPEDTIFASEGWDAASRSLSFQAWVYAYSSIAGASHREQRTLYFDGENFLIYNDQRHFDSHFMQWFDVENEVKNAMLEAVRQEFEAAGAPYDDWRITDLGGARILEMNGQTYHVFRVSCEFHTPEPREMPGLGVQDCWADPFAPDFLYLVFWDNDTDLTYLFTMRQYLWPSEEQLPERLAQVTDMTDAAAIQAQMMLDKIMKANTVTLTLLAPERGGGYKVDPQAGSGPNRAYYFTTSYDWSYASDPGDMPATSLLVMDGSNSFRFWPDSELVLLHTYQGDTWLRAVPNDDPEDPFTVDIFDYMRFWYDEAEFAGLR